MKHLISRVKQDNRFLALVVVLLLSSLVTGCGGGEDWVVNPANEHYYLVIECGEWADCEKQAVAKGAHLVTVNDEAEQTWLIATFGERELYWIGLNDEAEDGLWRGQDAG